MRGNETELVTAHKHENLELFGEGADKEPSYWSAVLNQAMMSGYINKEVENYGVLSLTKEGKKYIKKPVPFYVVENTEFDDVYVDDGGEQSNALDEALHKMLLDLRSRIAKRFNVPPYIIFQDPSIDAMTTFYPITIDELQNIPGVGVGKARRYGKEFVELIRRHCEENEIERPVDMRVRVVANKSQRKISIIQSIDREVALDDIARMQGIDFDELLDILETIVYSGTKINIDYFIDEEIDEDKVDEIFDYFRSSQTDSLDEAFRHLDDDISEEEIRLVRIKFLSDLGN